VNWLALWKARMIPQARIRYANRRTVLASRESIKPRQNSHAAACERTSAPAKMIPARRRLDRSWSRLKRSNPLSFPLRRFGCRRPKSGSSIERLTSKNGRRCQVRCSGRPTPAIRLRFAQSVASREFFARVPFSGKGRRISEIVQRRTPLYPPVSCEGTSPADQVSLLVTIIPCGPVGPLLKAVFKVACLRWVF
jgi:hypothetical protein